MSSNSTTAARPYGRVYLVRNTKNGKVYVGQTVNQLGIRWSEHCHDALRRGRKYPFQAALRKYGPESFSLLELAVAASQPELDRLEQEFIALHRSMERGIGYNVRAGGNSGGALSPETRRKLRECNLGKPAPNKGKPMPEHQRLAMIERFRTQGHPCLGKKCSEETKAAIGAANRIKRKGTVASDETKRKMSEAQRRRYAMMTPESRTAEKASRIGVNRPDFSEALRRRWAKPELIERRNLVIRMRNSGSLWKQIALVLGVHRSTVQEIYARHAEMSRA